jgi:hypothetical protein
MPVRRNRISKNRYSNNDQKGGRFAAAFLILLMLGTFNVCLGTTRTTVPDIEFSYSSLDGIPLACLKTISTDDLYQTKSL